MAELRTSLRAAAAQSVKSARTLAKFDEINRLAAPAAEKATTKTNAVANKTNKTGGSTRKTGSSRSKAKADGEVGIWQAALQTLRNAWDGFWLYLQS